MPEHLIEGIESVVRAAPGRAIKFGNKKENIPMAKWADFGISAVQYDKDHKHIVKARVHPDNGDTIGASTDTARQTIVSRIEASKTFVTITKNKDDKWQKGQPVIIVTINNVKYIKTVENSKESDNLENLPEF